MFNTFYCKNKWVLFPFIITNIKRINEKVKPKDYFKQYQEELDSLDFMVAMNQPMSKSTKMIRQIIDQ